VPRRLGVFLKNLSEPRCLRASVCS